MDFAQQYAELGYGRPSKRLRSSDDAISTVLLADQDREHTTAQRPIGDQSTQHVHSHRGFKLWTALGDAILDTVNRGRRTQYVSIYSKEYFRQGMDLQHAEGERTTECVGMMQIRDVLATMERIDTFKRGEKKRYEDQMAVCNIMLACAVQFFLREQYAQCYEELCALFKTAGFEPFGLLSAPRQCGKTECIIRLIVAILYCHPHVHIGYFAHQKALVEANMRRVYDALTELLAYDRRSLGKPSYNKSENRIALGLEGSNVDCKILTGQVGLPGRGTGFEYDIVIMDEVERCHVKSIFESMMPILGNRYRCFIGLSTWMEEGHHMSLLAETKLKDKAIFKQKHITVTCDECVKKDIICVHRAHLMPPFKSLARQEMLYAIMEPFPEYRASELAGRMRTDNSRAFGRELVERLSARTNVPDTEISNADCLFIAVDPSNGSGERSQLGIWSAYFESYAGRWVIVGLDGVHCPDLTVDMQKTVHDHVKLLRKRFPYIPIVTVVEANLQVHADVVCRTIAEASVSRPSESVNVHHMRHPPPSGGSIPQLGVDTLPNLSWPLYHSTMQTVLASERLWFGSELTTARGKNAIDVKNKYITQLKNFRAKMNYKENGKITRTYSGKAVGDGMDDMAAASMLGLFYAHNLVVRHERYSNTSMFDQRMLLMDGRAA